MSAPDLAGLTRTAALAAALAFPAAAGAQEAVDWTAPDAIARLFQEACLDAADKPAGVIDWALAHGFDPVDALGGSADDLLGGEAGTVLAAPVGHGRVLVAGGAGRCTVWVEGTVGGPLRAAVARMLAINAGKGAKIDLQFDRSLERAGAWRSQQQWRFRAMGGTKDFGLGAVTTLSDAPGNQALQMIPLPATPTTKATP